MVSNRRSESVCLVLFLKQQDYKIRELKMQYVLCIINLLSEIAW